MDNMTEGSLLLPPKDRYPSHGEWEKACWKKIIKSEKFLETLVTSYERHNITMRAAVMDLVNSGKSFRQIARDLQISTQTVNSIKKAVRDSYKSYRERGKTERKKKIYSRDPSKKKPYRHYRRTKYGKVYLPYY